MLAQRFIDIPEGHTIARHAFPVAIVRLVDQTEDPGNTSVGLARVAVLDTDRATPALRNGHSSRRVERDQRRGQKLARFRILGDEHRAARGALAVRECRGATALWAIERAFPVLTAR